MAQELRFDGRVVVVTGAGGGLGRSHALLFASRGASVVVNDLGGSATGDGKSARAADAVVEEIKAMGGQAVANYDSVEDGDKIIQTALTAFKKVDVVINNAGILRDVSFPKMTDADWDLIMKVHVRGAYKVTKAAWDVMRDQGYGRVIFTASAAGIYGNFGQANYSTAKLGLLGFSNTLALEGQKRNIHVNTIAPIAGSRLTETVLPPELIAALKPEVVSPLVAWLCHESCNETGGLFEVGGGFFSKLRFERTEGVTFRLGRTISVEDVKGNFDRVTDFAKTTHPTNINESMAPIMKNVQAGPSRGGNEHIDVDLALGYELPAITSSYSEKDLAIYALGVGAAKNPLDDKGLQTVYELHGDGMRAIPSYGVIPAINTILTLAKEGQTAPGLKYGLDRILHGEQSTELVRPLPTSAKLTHKSRIVDIFDKGKNAVVVTETKSFDEDGDLLLVNRFSAIVRGAGGWGGDRGPVDEKNVPPSRAPDAVVEERVPENQALLYRLSGDWNPLHADPAFASAFGFEKPILHGLCTYGYACRHVVEKMAKDGDPRFVKKIEVRFADPVIPGETLVTEMWRESPTRVVFTTKVKERDKVVLSKAAVEFHEKIPTKEAKKPAAQASAPSSSSAASSEPQSAGIFRAIGAYVDANPDLKDKVKTVYRFELKSPSSTWTVDLKAGKVEQGGAVAAECTLALDESDFMAMVEGKVEANKLYFGGKLKITGNVMASQKLNFLSKIDRSKVGAPAAAASSSESSSASSSASSSEPSSAGVFRAIGAYVAANPDLKDKVKTVYRFELKNPSSTWTLDLKAGKVEQGGATPAECTLTLDESDFMDMTSGKAEANKLYFGGKLKIAGNVMASQKLNFLTKIDKSQISAAPKSAAPSAPTSAASSSSESQAHTIFTALAAKKDLSAPKGDVTYHFRVKGPDSATTSDWIVAFKGGKASVEKGTPKAADTTLTLTESDLFALVRGEEPLTGLYQRGRIRVDGAMQPARDVAFLKGLTS